MCFSCTIITSISRLVIATKLVYAYRQIHGWAEFCIQCCVKNGVLTSAGTILAANVQTIPCVKVHNSPHYHVCETVSTHTLSPLRIREGHKKNST